MSKDPILIAGAGPTGLVLAIWLKTIRPSIPLKIISKASRPGTTSRAIVVHARTVEYYRQLGIADKLIQNATVLDNIHILRHGIQKGRLSFRDIGAGQSNFPFVLSVSQETHEQVLLDHLKTLGVSVEWEQELQLVEQFPGHVMVTINDNEERFAYVMGCDGAHSVVRKACQLQMRGGTYPQRFFVADVRVSEDIAITGVNVSPNDDIMVVFIKLTDTGHCRMIGAYTLPENIKDPTFEHVRDAVKASTALDVKKVEWFSVYRVRHSVADHFRDRRVFLVGDAAHQHSPVGGQGMNTGIGDASNLAWKLASVYEGSAPDELLDTYHSERYDVAQSLVNSTDRLFTLMSAVGWLGWLVRSLFMPYILPLIWKIPAARPRYFQIVSQIGVAYSSSALSEQQHSASGKQIYAGQRLPWLHVGKIDTHDPLPYPQWHIISFVADKERGDAAATVGEIPIRSHSYTQEAESKGFVKDKVYLVRPDGHIGLICDGLEDPRLGRYLEKWGVGAL